MATPSARQQQVLSTCQRVFESWRGLRFEDFDFDDPKGFSSFTMGVRASVDVDPPAVLYRHLDGKENAILDSTTERSTFLLLGQERIAAHCYHYDLDCRIEAFYRGRTLTAADVFDPRIQQGIADELHRLHQLEPVGLPTRTFFELLHKQWGTLARSVIVDRRREFPDDEQVLCADLEALYSDATHEMVMRCLPDSEPVFCHNDTYHGNVFLLDDGTVKLLDFEFSCRNHICFDFANLFAETVMVHGLESPPHFGIDEPRFTDADLASLIGFYLDNEVLSAAERASRLDQLVGQTRRALMASDYMYAMAALPLALEPIQKIRFLPYAHARFQKFVRSWHEEFGP